jgi:hypothetical protein
VTVVELVAELVTVGLKLFIWSAFLLGGMVGVAFDGGFER